MTSLVTNKFYDLSLRLVISYWEPIRAINQSLVRAAGTPGGPASSAYEFETREFTFKTIALSEATVLAILQVLNSAGIKQEQFVTTNHGRSNFTFQLNEYLTRTGLIAKLSAFGDIWQSDWAGRLGSFPVICHPYHGTIDYSLSSLVLISYRIGTVEVIQPA